MISNAYQYVNKGSWRALSFILAITITAFFFFNIQQFSTALRSQPAFLVISLLWATVIMWIHGMGLEFHRTIWKIVFFPYIGYILVVVALINTLFYNFN